MASGDRQDRVTVSISHPDGLRLPFTENLLEFLANRPNKRARFFIGHWLASLDGPSLDRLVGLAEDIALRLAGGMVDGCEGGDDLVGVAIHALAAETGKTELNAEELPAHLGGLYFMAGMEQARRAGWMTLEGELSLADPSRGVANLTDKGLREMPEILRRTTH